MAGETSKERRRGAQRRLINLGPPPGVMERRVNIERRLFNLDLDSLDDWLGKPASRAGRGDSAPN